MTEEQVSFRAVFFFCKPLSPLVQYKRKGKASLYLSGNKQSLSFSLCYTPSSLGPTLHLCILVASLIAFLGVSSQFSPHNPFAASASTRRDVSSIPPMRSWAKKALEMAAEATEEGADVSDEEMPELVYDEWQEDFEKLSRNAYRIVLERLPLELIPLVRQLELDDETRTWLRTTPPKSYFVHSVLWVLNMWMAKTEAMGYMRCGHMHVLSPNQATQLLIPYLPPRPRRLLDVGAGSGGPTAALAPLFDEIVTTEAAKHMAAQLRERGFKCVETCDLLAAEELRGELFDVVALFNVLDRCLEPFSLLSAIKYFLRPQTGVLLVATVLPFRPAVEGPDGESLFPAEDQYVRVEHGRFEAMVGEFYEKIIKRAGYVVKSVSRVPYLSEGDVNRRWYKLDNAIFVLQPCIEPVVEPPCP